MVLQPGKSLGMLNPSMGQPQVLPHQLGRGCGHPRAHPMPGAPMLASKVLLANAGRATRMMSLAWSWREWGAMSLHPGRLPAPLSGWGQAGRALSLADVPGGAPLGDAAGASGLGITPQH